MRLVARNAMCLAALGTVAFAHAQDAPSLLRAREQFEALMRMLPEGDDEAPPPPGPCFRGVCPQEEREIAATLVRLGPQHGGGTVEKPSVVGFVRDSWPVVVDFEPEPHTFTVFRVKLYHRRWLFPYYEIAFQQVIDPDGTGGRQTVVVPRLDLADNAGAGVRVARYDIRSFRLADDGKLVREHRRLVRAPVAIYGMGAGPHAVGSSTLRNIRFLSPTTIRVPAANSPQAVSFGYTLDRDYDAVAAVPRFCNPRCSDLGPWIGSLPRFRSAQATGRWTINHRARAGSYELDVRAWLQCGGATQAEALARCANDAAWAFGTARTLRLTP